MPSVSVFVVHNRCDNTNLYILPSSVPISSICDTPDSASGSILPEMKSNCVCVSTWHKLRLQFPRMEGSPFTSDCTAARCRSDQIVLEAEQSRGDAKQICTKNGQITLLPIAHGKVSVFFLYVCFISRFAFYSLTTSRTCRRG